MAGSEITCGLTRLHLSMDTTLLELMICQFVNELAMLFEDWKKVLSAIPPAQIYVVDKLKVDQMPIRRKRYGCNLQINLLKNIIICTDKVCIL